jgi:uncharacterized protein YyaL (SSP411 family)
VIAARAALAQPARPAAPVGALSERAVQERERAHDPRNGGFGTAPKFPSTVNLEFLLRVAACSPERRERALAMVLRQLDAMRAGGIHDHIGGGFHRYSTDATWLVPHFEKMLYDQALIALASLDAHQLAGRPEDAEIARDIFAYVLRDLTSDEGAFFSAEDADSEGEEGVFYVWTPAALGEALGEDEARWVAARYGVTAEGNFEHGASILHEARSLTEVAQEVGASEGDLAARWPAARARLLAARAQRPRPHRDDKVVTAWNGLMIAALARGARVLAEPELGARAARAAEFLWTRLRDATNGDLCRRWREGEAAEAGQLDDFADLAFGLLELYAATFDPVWLERAVTLTERQVALFWDDVQGGFFESPEDPSIRVRLKDGYDGAEVAGNSIAAWNLHRLGALLDRGDWLEKASRTFDHYARRLEPFASAMPRMLMAMDLGRRAPRHVVIAGDPRAEDTRAMVGAFDRRYLPDDLLMLVDGGERQERLARLAPFVAPLAPANGRATAFICVDRACRLPTQDLDAFVAALEDDATDLAQETPR